MLQKIKTNYNHTIYASYLGYITQAIINNFAPLLFLTFVAEYDLTIDKITIITTINFLVQLAVDLVSAKLLDKIGYRKSIMAAHLCAATGLIGLAVLPRILSDPYMGILMAVVLYAIGGGIIEVLISPIVEACPTEKKEAAMSLLHSFYCWGHVFLVVMSTLFFYSFGIENWRILACIWALVPLANIVYFGIVPIYPIAAGHEKLSVGKLFKNKVFWGLMLLMVCAGASEQGMSQWASAFAESALGISKTMGDLAGPCAFAIFMGIARALYGRYSEQLPLNKFMAGSALLCIICYLLAAFGGNPVLGLVGCALCGFSVGIFWPGTFSMAAIQLPGGGTAMYALMALAGDLGCGAGPTLVGMGAQIFGGDLKLGLCLAIVFPVIIFAQISRIKK